MTSICVYCGSSKGRSDKYVQAAEELASVLVERELRLVYGGATVGVMGALADKVLQLGGHVVGVMPESLLAKEIGHQGLTEMHVAQTMHERKTLMADLADGFIAMPGGAGTLEELFEVWTWGQLGFHYKPCGLLNTAGYFNHLIAFLNHTVTEQFVRPAHRDMLIVESDPLLLLDTMSTYTAPTVSKWIN